MARIRRWKEKLALACFTLLFSIPRALALGTQHTARHSNVSYSRLLTGMNGKTALGVELMTRRPFVRLIRTSRVPLPIALAPGALMAMAAPLAAPVPASSCPAGGGTCKPSTAVCTVPGTTCNVWMCSTPEGGRTCKSCGNSLGCASFVSHSC